MAIVFGSTPIVAREDRESYNKCSYIASRVNRCQRFLEGLADVRPWQILLLFAVHCLVPGEYGISGGSGAA